ncbi:polysaccharide pyruvyl transferase family protein [Clostridium saudiense]|uniref:Polysaccharide pyruvyl transferase family protein n=1 Tax=Clostridium saudiense TaxID=1414720 RepID=A0ABS2FIH8_9CLOT|nr:polysaccharide pyruvyl transferase family protein [Clostridium saudiense]MBM6820169.1 polysaccharide pyruvyl transferase family protein [Clostridium saudiense]
MKKKRIGLVSPYNIVNYGTKLQAFAMQEIIKTYGMEPQIVNYFPKYDRRPHILFKKVKNGILKNKNNDNGKNVNSKVSEKLAIRSKSVNSFDKKYNLSKSIKGYGNLKASIVNYDAFICGSDQIWAEGNLITDFYSLEFVNNKKRTIAYAPSFGTATILDKNKDKYRKFIRNIDYVSVREESGKKLIKDIAQREVKQVVDPTLLVDRKVWIDLISGVKNEISEKYIFCYFLGISKEHRQAVEELKKKTGYKIVNLPFIKCINEADENFGDYKLFDVSPEKFIKLISEAEYICTDSFHGTIFSVIFQKKFYVFERFNRGSEESTNTRLYSLLKMLKLEQQLISNPKYILEVENQNIDYKKVNGLLDEQRKISSKFLNEALMSIN